MDLTRRNVLAGIGAATLAGGMATVVPHTVGAESGESGFDGSPAPQPQQAPIAYQPQQAAPSYPPQHQAPTAIHQDYGKQRPQPPMARPARSVCTR